MKVCKKVVHWRDDENDGMTAESHNHASQGMLMNPRPITLPHLLPHRQVLLVRLKLRALQVCMGEVADCKAVCA